MKETFLSSRIKRVETIVHQVTMEIPAMQNTTSSPSYAIFPSVMQRAWKILHCALLTPDVPKISSDSVDSDAVVDLSNATARITRTLLVPVCNFLFFKS